MFSQFRTKKNACFCPIREKRRNKPVTGTEKNKKIRALSVFCCCKHKSRVKYAATSKLKVRFVYLYFFGFFWFDVISFGFCAGLVFCTYLPLILVTRPLFVNRTGQKHAYFYSSLNAVKHVLCYVPSIDL